VPSTWPPRYFLYISLEFAAPPDNPNLLYQLHIDTDLDGSLDYYLVQRPGVHRLWRISWRDGVGTGHPAHPGPDGPEDGLPSAVGSAGRSAHLNLGFRVRPVDEDLTLDNWTFPAIG
jgi:hypothetical protein